MLGELQPAVSKIKLLAAAGRNLYNQLKYPMPISLRRFSHGNK